MPDIPAPEVAARKGMVAYILVKKWVGVTSVRFKPGKRKVDEEEVHAISFMLGSSADFLDLADDMPISIDDIVEEVAPWYLWNLMSKNGCQPSALQSGQQRCRAYGLSVLSDDDAVQKILKDAIAALVSTDEDGMSLAKPKK